MEQLHALGQGLADQCRFLFHGMSHIERVGFGLSHDSKTHHRDPVAAQNAAVVFGSPLHKGNVLQTDQVALEPLPNHQPSEIFGRIKQTCHPNGELFAGRFHAARGKLHVLVAQCLFDVGHRDVLGGHGLSVEPDTHGVAARTADKDPRDAIQHGKLVHQVTFGIIGQGQSVRSIADQVQPHDDAAVGIDFKDFRRVGLVRQVVQDA